MGIERPFLPHRLTSQVRSTTSRNSSGNSCWNWAFILRISLPYSPFSQISHKVWQNRLAKSPLPVVKPTPAGFGKINTKRGAASLIAKSGRSFGIEAAGPADKMKTCFDIEPAGVRYKLEKCVDIGLAGP